MFCQRVKEFLSQRGLDFVDRDITIDEEALAELDELGYMTSPVTVIDGEVVIGFDLAKFEELLEA
ncbi:MAG: NrdH-redoxin [Chloroflexi bacterium B3_Chlor]|nr:MAG: NrdH-redoxin [Chloroflexi bacterium B3_Chlor]